MFFFVFQHWAELIVSVKRRVAPVRPKFPDFWVEFTRKIEILNAHVSSVGHLQRCVGKVELSQLFPTDDAADERLNSLH